MACAPSTEPVVEKDQHEPHWPWFLTGVTAFLVRQSTVVSLRCTRGSSLEYEEEDEEEEEEEEKEKMMKMKKKRRSKGGGRKRRW